MKVILTKDVSGLGRANQIKDVSDGHARNFLIPKHLALPATAQVLAKVQKEEKEKQEKLIKLQERNVSLRNNLEGKTFTIRAKAEKQNLFAAVHEDQIAKLLAVEPEKIIISQPIKSLGLHEVEVKFSDNLKAKVKLDVQSLT